MYANRDEVSDGSRGPAAARGPVFAQGSLTGTVRDASGAVLPGVTVEAASPALIEKTRSAVDRRHGPVPHHRSAPRHLRFLTFTLTGFNAVQAREHRADRHAGRHDSHRDESRRASRRRSRSTGESPVVDVQTARSARSSWQGDVIQALPVARAAGALLNATPGL